MSQLAFESSTNIQEPEEVIDDDLVSEEMNRAFQAWTECARLLEERDGKQVQAWSTQIDALLVWVGTPTLSRLCEIDQQP